MTTSIRMRASVMTRTFISPILKSAQVPIMASGSRATIPANIARCRCLSRDGDLLPSHMTTGSPPTVKTAATKPTHPPRIHRGS